MRSVAGAVVGAFLLSGVAYAEVCKTPTAEILKGAPKDAVAIYKGDEARVGIEIYNAVAGAHRKGNVFYIILAPDAALLIVSQDACLVGMAEVSPDAGMILKTAIEYRRTPAANAPETPAPIPAPPAPPPHDATTPDDNGVMQL